LWNKNDTKNHNLKIFFDHLTLSVNFGQNCFIKSAPDQFENPHQFNPDRFVKDGKFVSDERVVPFGIGRRACIGQTLAEKEFYIFFAGIMQQVRN
jgi:hypothetical protein